VRERHVLKSVFSPAHHHQDIPAAATLVSDLTRLMILSALSVIGLFLVNCDLALADSEIA